MTARQAIIRAKTARSEEDYRSLADFYMQRERLFSTAAEQQHEALEYALKYSGGKSYPQAADRARMLGEYYESEPKRAKL
ncbi:hypothetical protein JAO29_14405 [Edaphobacter sp. HDX4]|uniref:hypothetical protein n=1 Tax=Edaphobacter sp. HDX4 TaxID=2794064 RepID=UPI002FE5B4A4